MSSKKRRVKRIILLAARAAAQYTLFTERHMPTVDMPHAARQKWKRLFRVDMVREKTMRSHATAERRSKLYMREVNRWLS